MKYPLGNNDIILVSPADLKCDDSPLRLHSGPVAEINDEVRVIAARMADVLLTKSPHGTGISAIQIGIPLRIVLLNHTRRSGAEIVLINPIPIQIFGRPFQRKEGCLSLPNYHGEVTRRNKIRVRATDLCGQELIYSTSGYEATVVQHELDHLDGILYWDRMTNDERPQARPMRDGSPD